MNVRISRDDLNRIMQAAAQRPEEEVCGLLLGRGNYVMDILPVTNVAATPETHFELDPAAHIQAQRQARERDMRIIGHYHSHPSGLARPSPTDAARACGDGAIWLICTPAGEYHFWRAVGEGLHGQFQPIAAEII
ncbi:MAG: M67 family peptidase [Sphingobium sp.]|nr:M67 family peptidase [Sphingobium sp.]